MRQLSLQGDCDTAQPFIERRAGPRVRTIFAHGKISQAGSEQICRVRNISPQGINLEGRGLPEAGQHVAFEMRGMKPVSAMTVWNDQNRCGLVFETEQDLDSVFAQRGASDGLRLRSPRFSLRLPAELAFREGTEQLDLVNISIGGAKLAGDSAAVADSHGVIRIAGIIGDLCGRVRWRRSGSIGVRFDTPISHELVSSILNFSGPCAGLD